MRALFTLCTLIFLSLPSFALDAHFKHSVYLEPSYGAYVETYMLFNGSTLRYKQVDGDSNYQASLELTYIFTQDDKVVEFSKNIINGPLLNDTLKAIQNFVDQQRFPLAPGVYNLSITLKDLHNRKDSNFFQQPIHVKAPANEPFFGDILLAGSAQPTEEENVFSRAGYDVVPRVSTFYGPQDRSLIFYSELYQTEVKPGEKEAFALVLDVLDLETETELDQYHSIQRKSGTSWIPVLKSFDISDLPNGNYLIRLEARNRNNEVIASRGLLFQRMNSFQPADSLADDALQKTFVHNFTNKDSLKLMCYCLRPKAEGPEREFIDKSLDTANMVALQRFFYGFWYDRNPITPQSQWDKYHNEIEKVDAKFSSKNRHGCATDQGRVYLEYGKPDGSIARPRTSVFYPYEIWHYYATSRKANAKFVFYDPTAGAGASYTLLHSNILGERADYNWFYTLQQRTGAPNTNDEVGAYDTFGVNPVEDFNLPP